MLVFRKLQNSESKTRIKMRLEMRHILVFYRIKLSVKLLWNNAKLSVKYGEFFSKIHCSSSVNSRIHWSSMEAAQPQGYTHPFLFLNLMTSETDQEVYWYCSKRRNRIMIFQNERFLCVCVSSSRTSEELVDFIVNMTFVLDYPVLLPVLMWFSRQSSSDFREVQISSS